MNNDDAFPTIVPQDWHSVDHGLSKRELFAAMAMQGMLACPDSSGSFAEIANWSVRYADALLAELAKPVKVETGGGGDTMSEYKDPMTEAVHFFGMAAKRCHGEGVRIIHVILARNPTKRALTIANIPQPDVAHILAHVVQSITEGDSRTHGTLEEKEVPS